MARLLDLGVEPYLVSSTLLCVLAQRLVRRVCPHCAQEAAVPQDEARELGIAGPASCRLGAGCGRCMGTGYLGRIGLYELLSAHDELREQIERRESTVSVRHAAVRRGMKTLREDGVDKVLAGVTSASEVLRVTRYEGE